MTAEATARRAAAAMWEGDAASQGLGMEVLQADPGRAVLAMTIRADMLNGHQIAHGGFIFTLADSAFAYACNSHGITTVAAQCQVTFLRPARLGDRLVAEALVITEGGRSGLNDVTVRVGDRAIAEFRGYSRSLGTSFLPEDSSPGEG